MSEASLLVAQITDTHLFATPHQRLLGLETEGSLQTILDSLRTLQPRPDLILLTGDLSQDGSAESYDRLQALLSPLGIPTYWIPGNHDEPALMAEVLTRSPFSAQKSFHAGGWHFLLLDSTVPGCVHGHLSLETVDWLDRELNQSTHEPALIAIHHPPFPVGSDWMNDIGLRNAADLLAVGDRHPRLKLVLFGHIHQEFFHTRRGVEYLGTPSTCIQFKPNSSTFLLDEAHPGLRLLRLFPDGTWQSEVQRIPYMVKPDLTAVGY